jgi:small subunit ribosomal protein S3
VGQKIHPMGFRVGISKNWKSNWFASKELYGDYILLDKKIRDYLQEKLMRAGLESIEIDRSINDISVKVNVSKPGMVIGRGGTGAEEVKAALVKLSGQEINFEVVEYRTPDISARIIGDSIVNQIQRRISYKRAINVAADKAIEKGALGVKIMAKGVLGGASSIARIEKVTQGSIPLQTLRADVDFYTTYAHTSYGSIGIKVWVYKGDIEI